MNQHNNITKLYDAQLSQQVNYCMNTTAEYYCNCLTADDAFLFQRGISYATAQRFLVGRAQGKTNLFPYLSQKGVPAEIIAQCGLLNKNGNDLFQNQLVFPIYLGEQVVDFIGRYVGDNPAYPKYWRLPRERVVTGHSHFNWDMTRSEIILVEGVIDALSLIDKGFEGAVATGGTNGLNEMLLRRSITLGLKKVWVCFDGDDAGRKRGLVLAYKLADMGLKVRMVTLPDGQDPNDFLLEHSADDFTELLRTAVIPEHWAISQVSDDLDTQARVEALEGVMIRINGLPPMTRAPLIDLIAAKTGISKKDVQAHVEELAQQAQANSADFAEYEQIHPALHFGHKETLITYPFLGEDGWVPWVITSERELFRLTREELRGRGYFCGDLLYSERQHFSQQCVREFLAGRNGEDLVDVFFRIRKTLQSYCDFEDPNTYDYLTAWTIGTYFFPLFNYYPYLHFTGTKEVGKSKTIKLMSLMSWNGKMSVSLSDASMYRIISEELPTLFLDESENLSDKTHSERRALLLGGFEKGTKATRVEQVNGAFKVRDYDNYCPRVFASINKMDDVLASRSMQIVMSRSFNDLIKENEVTLTDERFREIRDSLFTAVMTYGPNVRSMYEEITERPSDVVFDSREWNLFKPLFTIGQVVGHPEVLDNLIEFANTRYQAKTDTMNDTAVENVVLRFLLDFVQVEGEYGSKVLHRGLVEFIRAEGINVGEIREDYFGLLLTNLHVCDKRGRKMINGERQTFYGFNPERVRLVAANYRAKK